MRVCCIWVSVAARRCDAQLACFVVHRASAFTQSARRWAEQTRNFDKTVPVFYIRVDVVSSVVPPIRFFCPVVGRCLSFLWQEYWFALQGDITNQGLTGLDFDTTCMSNELASTVHPSEATWICEYLTFGTHMCSSWRAITGAKGDRRTGSLKAARV